MNNRKQEDRLLKGFIAFGVAAALLHFGDVILDSHIELFNGIAYFSFAWIAAVFILPFLAGIIVAYIFGGGGKWLAVFPPLLVRVMALYQVVNSPLPDHMSREPIGWWGFFLILIMESAMIGGVVGEVINKRTYGRRDKNLLYKKKPTR